MHCGLRVGEIFNLKFGDIDLANGIINIRDPKNGEDRVAYMTDEVKKILKGKDGKPDEYLFKDKDKHRIERVSKTFFRAVDDLGLNEGIADNNDKVVFHIPCGIPLSWLAISGTPIYTISNY